VHFFSRDGLVALFQRHGFSCAKLHTVSRINLTRVARKVPIPVVGKLAARGILAMMIASDSLGKRMFLNGYFQKDNSSPSGV
jgi:hypothetical protein